MIKKKNTTIVDQFCVISQHIINKGSDQVLFIIITETGFTELIGKEVDNVTFKHRARTDNGTSK